MECGSDIPGYDSIGQWVSLPWLHILISTNIIYILFVEPADKEQYIPAQFFDCRAAEKAWPLDQELIIGKEFSITSSG